MWRLSQRAAPNELEPTPTDFACGSLRLLARLTAGRWASEHARNCRYMRDANEKCELRVATSARIHSVLRGFVLRTPPPGRYLATIHSYLHGHTGQMGRVARCPALDSRWFLFVVFASIISYLCPVGVFAAAAGTSAQPLAAFFVGYFQVCRSPFPGTSSARFLRRLAGHSEVLPTGVLFRGSNQENRRALSKRLPIRSWDGSSVGAGLDFCTHVFVHHSVMARLQIMPGQNE